ncbi:MAG: copper chaperone PCu(A)C [Betaproteobacteria bacterium]|nr:copper chaperone PCu(A)C [Betaproteobacteria bacterium]
MSSSEPGAQAVGIAALFAGALALASAAHAAQPVSVKDAWVRVPAPGQSVASAYMELTSPTALALISVASPVAGRVELHAVTTDDGVMKMRPVGTIELPAGKPVKIAPGGLHVMLDDLKRPLKAGEKVPLTLIIQRADFSRAVFTIEAEARSATATRSHHH